MIIITFLFKFLQNEVFFNFVINLAPIFDPTSESESESESESFNFAINSLTSKSESDSESDFNSFFMNLDICVFFILYLHSSK